MDKLQNFINKVKEKLQDDPLVQFGPADPAYGPTGTPVTMSMAVRPGPPTGTIHVIFDGGTTVVAAYNGQDLGFTVPEDVMQAQAGRAPIPLGLGVQLTLPGMREPETIQTTSTFTVGAFQSTTSTTGLQTLTTPTVTNFAPTVVAFNQQGIITIYGTNLNAIARVEIGGTQFTINSSAATQLQVQYVGGVVTPGPYQIQLWPIQGGPILTAQQLQITPPL